MRAVRGRREILRHGLCPDDPGCRPVAKLLPRRHSPPKILPFHVPDGRNPRRVNLVLAFVCHAIAPSRYLNLAFTPSLSFMLHRTMTIPRLAAVARFDPSNLFRPASIAVVGLESEASAKMLANLAVGGYKGEIHTLHTISQLPDGVSLTLLALPNDQIGGAMAVMAARNCFAAIIPGEADNIREHATRTGVRALGPHSFGLAVPKLGINATLSHIQPPPGRLALVSQSSSFSRAVIDWAEPNGVGFSHIVGVGDNHDIGFGLVLDWLSRDAGHRRHPAGRPAHQEPPPVPVRRSRRREAAPSGGDPRRPSHDEPGRRGGSRVRGRVAPRRSAVVNRLEDLLAAAETLSRASPVRCDNLAIVSTAIGPGAPCGDAVLRAGLRSVRDQTITRVPADLAPTAFGLAARPGVGGVLVIHAPTGPATTPSSPA